MKKKRRIETRGRPSIDPHARKVTLSLRVRPDVKTGYEHRADTRDTSVGREVERAFYDTEERTTYPPT